MDHGDSARQPTWPMGDEPAILCLAHLGWDYVWQRPQHLLSRLARHYPVAYVNDPRIGPALDGAARLMPVADDGRLTAWQPLFPNRPDVIGRWREEYMRLVQDLLVQQGWARVDGGTLAGARPLILWFYTPTPVYMLDRIPAQLVVYDVMDELTSFKGAGLDLRVREEWLLARTDLVFTGGRSLYESRKAYHPRVHLFASGVDREHFAQTLSPATAVAPEIAHLPHPILGYYGVIDERLDLELLDQLANQHPDWSIVMVGPVTKIDPEELPRRPNLHYAGQQPYARLPGFLKGFDVCLMPFALTEATRFISPTKTLEYMAAHKPIVSTPVPDVVANWGTVVRIAAGAAAFGQAVAAALAETGRQRAERAAAEEVIIAAHSWDHIADQMRELMAAALTRRGGK